MSQNVQKTMKSEKKCLGKQGKLKKMFRTINPETFSYIFFKNQKMNPIDINEKHGNTPCSMYVPINDMPLHSIHEQSLIFWSQDITPL